MSISQALPRLTLVMATVGMSSARPQFSDPVFSDPLIDPVGAREEFHPATHLVVEVPAVPGLGFPDNKLGFFGEVYAHPHFPPHISSGKAPSPILKLKPTCPSTLTLKTKIVQIVLYSFTQTSPKIP